MEISRRQRTINAAIDTFAVIYWTLITLACLGAILGAIFGAY